MRVSGGWTGTFGYAPWRRRPNRSPRSWPMRSTMTSSPGVVGWTGTSRASPNARGRPQGIASLGPYAAEPSAGAIFGLYVVPEARNTGVSWRLVAAAAALASREGHRQLYYWVGIDNGRAVGFAKNFGFRSTGSRRPSRVADLALGAYETALVLSLVPDDTSVPNPTSDEPAPRHGPIG